MFLHYMFLSNCHENQAIHPSIVYIHSSLQRLDGFCLQIHWPLDREQSTPRKDHQAQGKHRVAAIHLHIHTKGQFRETDWHRNLCFWGVGESWSTQREPMHAQGENTNSMVPAVPNVLQCSPKSSHYIIFEIWKEQKTNKQKIKKITNLNGKGWQSCVFAFGLWSKPGMATAVNLLQHVTRLWQHCEHLKYI